jgi:hypothetical protein
MSSAKVITETGGKKMKKVLVCAVLATMLAFSVGGCSKQEESKEKGAVSETTGTMTEQKEAVPQQAGEAMDKAKEAGADQSAEMQQKSGDVTAPEPSATEAQQAGEKAAGTGDEKGADTMNK